jgi:hypothetical protein
MLIRLIQQHGWDEAAACFERALEKNRQMGARLWTAHTESGFARMLVQRGAPEIVSVLYRCCVRPWLRVANSGREHSG